MVRKLHIIVVFLLGLSCYPQDTIVQFGDAVKQHIKPYRQASAIALNKKDFKESERLFDSLVDHQLSGTHFDDFTIKSYRSKKVSLNKIKKPVLLVTYASWCVRNKGDIPALNALASKHQNDLQVVVLFWDNRKNIRKIAPQFNSKIKVCYANESYQSDFKIVATLKHTLGMPTVYYIDQEKKVVTINRIKNQSKIKISKDASFAASYTLFDQMIRSNSSKLSLGSND